MQRTRFVETVGDLSMINILLVDSISNQSLSGELLGEGYGVQTEGSIGDGIKAIHAHEFDIVILSLNLSGSTDLTNLHKLILEYFDMPIIVIVSDSQEERGKDALRNGAIDYILESECESPRLVKRIIRYALEKNEHERIKRDNGIVLDLARKVAKIGSWTWYPQTDVLITTPTFLNIFDLPEGKNQYQLAEFLKITNVDGRDKILENVKSHAVKQESISLELQIVSRENSFKHILIKGIPATDPSTGGSMYYGTSQDVTEIKQTSETLKQRDRFLELSGEIASVGGWEFDLRTKELYWTRASYDIHGRSEKYKPTFANLEELYPAEYYEDMNTAFYKALTAKQNVFMEAPIEIDGRVKWLQYIGKLVFDGDELIKVNGIVYDISQSKRQVKNLEIRAMMLDNVVEAAIAVDVDFKIIFWNKAAEKMFGYNRKETIGKSITKFDLTEMDAEEIKKLVKLLRTGENIADEYIMKDKFGRQFPVWSSLSAVMGNDNQPEAMLYLARDISEEKHHLKKIEDSEHRFRRLFEYSPVGKGLIDLKTFKWIDANNTLVKLLGYSKRQLLNITSQEITPPEFSKLDLFHLKKLNRHGVFGPYQKEYLKSDGSRVKVIITGFVMNQSIGQKAWVHVLDITELDEKTESLRKSEERLRDYVENSTDVILTIDENGMIDYISPNIKRSMDYSENEILGRPFLDFIHPDDHREALTEIEKAWGGPEEDLSIINRIRHKNGKYIYVKTEGKFKVAPTGEKYGIVIARNIDQEHRSELHVRHQNEILKEIAFIQSHVLRRPLANILGLIALNNLNETAPSDTLELFNLIQKEAVIMDEVVEDIVSKSTHISKLSGNE